MILWAGFNWLRIRTIGDVRDRGNEFLGNSMEAEKLSAFLGGSCAVDLAESRSRGRVLPRPRATYRGLCNNTAVNVQRRKSVCLLGESVQQSVTWCRCADPWVAYSVARLRDQQRPIHPLPIHCIHFRRFFIICHRPVSREN